MLEFTLTNSLAISQGIVQLYNYSPYLAIKKLLCYNIRVKQIRKQNRKELQMGYSKLYGRQVFRAEVEGKKYVFTCYTQYGQERNRHICCKGFSDTENPRYVRANIIGKCIYYNRTWERFKYETALRNGIENIDATKEVKQELHDILIEGKAQKEHEETEAFINSFKAIHESLSEDNKSRLASMVDSLPNGMITTEEQAQSIKGIATLMSLMQ